MTSNNNICPICGEGHLKDHVIKNAVEYKEQSAELDTLFSTCDVCGSEQSNAVQLRANKRAMIAFKKQVDGLLTGTQVRDLRERLGISQAEAAQIFGGGPVAFSKYESDDVSQSGAMDKLLRLADNIPQVFAHLTKEAGVELQPANHWDKLEVEHRSKTRPTLRIISSSQPETDASWRKTG